MLIIFKDPDNIASYYKRYAPLAHQYAWRSNSTKKMAAVLVKGGSVLSLGYNRIKQDTKAYWQVSIHAELDALINAPYFQGKKTKMLVYRFSREKDHLVSSKPCTKCFALLQEYGVYSVTYLTPDRVLERVKL